MINRFLFGTIISIPAILFNIDPISIHSSIAEAKDEKQKLDQMISQAEVLNHEALRLRQQGKIDQAISKANEALHLSEFIYGPRHRNVAADLIVLGDLYVEKHEFAAAEPLVKRAINIDKQIYGPTDQ